MLKKILLYISVLASTYLFAHNEGGSRANNSYPFTPNEGQWHDNVIYKSFIGETALFLEKNAFHYQIYSRSFNHGGVSHQVDKEGIQVFKAKFVNANPKAELNADKKSGFYYNYYLGNDASKWKSKVYSFQEINYHNLYNGIDLKVYYQDGFLKYDYIVEAGSEVGQIKVQYEGIERLKLKYGNLILKHEFGELIEEQPYAYQIIDGEEVKVECNYLLTDNTLSFNFPNGYDKSKSLVIDPRVIFSTYSGASDNNLGMTATYDNFGNGYMGGTIDGSGYITTPGVYQANYRGGADIAISKFNSSDGSTLLYSTFLGGSGDEAVSSMVVDNNNRLIIMGVSGSSNFPVDTASYQGSKRSNERVDLLLNYGQRYLNGNDIIIAKFSENGDSLLGSTYFGGNSSTGLNFDSSARTSNNSNLNYNYGDHFRGEVNVDSTNNIYIGSSTHSTNLSTINAFSGLQDGIIAKFNTNLSQLIWARYHGGANDDAIYSLKVIDSNKVLVGGGTRSYNNFPITQGTYSDSSFGGRADGFISIISADGTTVERSTFIGTSNYDQVYFIEYDRFKNVYAFGQTRGGLFPLKNTTVADSAGGQFIIKMDPNLDSLIISHTFGDSTNDGTINISPTAFLVDRCLNMYISGWGGSMIGVNDGPKTLPSNMPIEDPFRSTTDGNDFYFYVINRDADSLIHASYFGGTASDDHVDGGTSRFDKNGVVYQSVCGSCGFPPSTLNDFYTSDSAFAKTKGVVNGYGCNNVLFKYDFEIAPVADFRITQSEFCLSQGDTVSVFIENLSRRGNNTIWDFYGTPINSEFQDTTIYLTTPSTYRIRQTVQDTICVLGNFADETFIIRPDDILLSIDEPDSLICYSDSVELKVYHNGQAGRFSWSRTPNFNNPLLITSDSIVKLPLDTGENTFYLRADNPTTNACPKFDTTITFKYNPAIASISLSEDSICENTPINFNSTILNVDTFSWDLGNGQNRTDTNFSYTYTNSGNYEMKFIYENYACSTQDTLIRNIEVRANNLAFDTFSDSLFCGLGDFEIGVSSLGTAKKILFSSDTTFSDTLNNYPNDSNLVINSDGNYQYYIQISDGLCFATDSIESTYISYEVDMDLLTEDSVCTPYNLPINSTVVGVDSFRIDFGDGNFTTTDPDPTITYTDEGIYQIQLAASNARCNLTDTINREINVFQNVELSEIKDTLICLGDTIQLKGNSSGTAAQFIWADNSNYNNPLNAPQDSVILISPQAPQNTFYLKGENKICSDEIDVNVDVENLVVETDDLLSICLGDTIEVNADVINSTAQLTFDWQPEDSIIQGQTTTRILTAPKDTTWFTLLTISSTGCEDFDSSLVEVAVPAFDSVTIITESDSAYRGQKIQLSTDRNEPNLVYQWEPANLMDNPNSPNPTITIQNTTIVTLTIIDLNTGCEVFAEKRLKVYEINCAEPEIFIPSAFTPNGDNNNDVFYVRGSNLYSIELEIYNRWGELVFRTDDLNSGWDGTYNGREADPGVFVYHLKAVCLDKQEYFTKGNLTLIR